MIVENVDLVGNVLEEDVDLVDVIAPLRSIEKL